MITLFKRVREQLIGQHNVSRYLLYAAGEILLVVVGILIALQVNNWNEERIRQNEEVHYLTSLRSDFESAEASFDFILGAVEEQLTHNEQILHILAGPVGSVPGDSLVGMLRKAFIDVPFNVQVTAYSDLLNSGRLSVLQSEDLRRALTGFETANALANDYANRAAAQWAGQVTEFFINRLNVSAIYGERSEVHWDHPGIPPTEAYENTPVNRRFSSDEDALWGRELANRIAIKNVLLEDAAGSAREVLQYIETILTHIDASLDKS